MLVTGSAKLDTYRKVGDSLAGRFFQYRLHPLDLKEIALLKEIHRLNDIYGKSYNSHYLRTKEGFEIDFLVTGENNPVLLLEVKWDDDKPNRNFSRFNNYFPSSRKVQIVKELDREKTFPDGLEIRKAHTWLSDL